MPADNMSRYNISTLSEKHTLKHAEMEYFFTRAIIPLENLLLWKNQFFTFIAMFKDCNRFYNSFLNIKNTTSNMTEQ